MGAAGGRSLTSLVAPFFPESSTLTIFALCLLALLVVWMRLRVHSTDDVAAMADQSMTSKLEEGAEKLGHRTTETGQTAGDKAAQMGEAAKHRVEEAATSAKNIGK